MPKLIEGGFLGDYLGDYYRVSKGDTRSLDYGSYGFGYIIIRSPYTCYSVLGLGFRVSTYGGL